MLLLGSTALAQAPASIANHILHGTITAGTGVLPTSGTFSQLFTEDTDYNIALNGGVPAEPQDYVYAVTGANTATITETGLVVTLTFTSATAGTFSTNFGGGNTQSGTFQLEALGGSGGSDGPPPLVNISTRLPLAANGQAIGGFAIAGSEPRTVLVRVVGPGLEDKGVPNFLPDPMLTVFDSTSTAIATNDDWDEDTTNRDEVNAAITATGAFALVADDADAAMVLTLDPGTYTVIGESTDDTSTGEIIIEVYLVE